MSLFSFIGEDWPDYTHPDLFNSNPDNDVFKPEYWLAVHAAPKIRPRNFLKLLAAFGSPQAILEASFSQLRSLGIATETCEALAEPDWQHIYSNLNWLAEHDARLITLADSDYPQSLKNIADPPPVLFVMGDARLLRKPQIAMVGSRNPTPTGAESAYQFAASLAHAGLCVTSGMALGIDAQSHRGAISTGAPTIAVVGTGIDRTYPASHKSLARTIAGQGAIISEFPLGLPPLAKNFPQRNRIISGLSLGVLVVEAALKSGSLITARQALDQNRDVFAIPGSIHSPQSRGCHHLLREGARLVETAQDILDELRFDPEPFSAPNSHGSTAATSDQKLINLDQDHAKLLSCVGFEPTSVDTIVTRSGLTPEQVCSMLLLLELQNQIVSTASGQYSRVSKQ